MKLTREDQENLIFLEALERAGVDNWDGYDYAQEIFNALLKAREAILIPEED